MKPERKKSPAPIVRTANLRGLDDTEPVASGGSVPIWFFIALALLVYCGLLYLDDSAGGFNSDVYEPYYSYAQLKKLQPQTVSPLIAQGREVFGRTCAPCHQPTGTGTPGQFPPLAKSDWVNVAGPNRMIRIVLNGLQGPITVNGTEFNNAMVPWKDTLKDDEIAAVISFVRQEWGNKAPAVKPEEVKVIRADTKDRSDPWTSAELLKIPEGGAAQ